MLKLFLIFLTITPLGACSLLQSNPVADQLVIQELTALAIQSGCANSVSPKGQTAVICYNQRAAKVAAIAASLKTATVGMAVADVTNLLQGELKQLNLTPEETAPINVFVTSLINYLVTKYGGGALTTTAVATVQTVAGWILATASMYI